MSGGPGGDAAPGETQHGQENERVAETEVDRQGNDMSKGPIPPPELNRTQVVQLDAEQFRLQTGEMRLGEFLLLKRLGKGATGTVYLARQESQNRDVAVKVLAKHLASNPTILQRFQREARLMAALDNSHILRGYAVGEDHGYHYLAMEYVDGTSLGSWLQKVERLSVGDALHIVLAALDGLQYAHEQGLIHRDIKPDNILITSAGAVKVADLGLAKGIADDLSLTQTGFSTGTPVYMSPEQTRDSKHIDRRSDIYSLGIVLYACLTGVEPFKGETFIQLFEAKQRGIYVPARRLNDEVPDRLDYIIDRMLAKDPKFRYQNCAEVWRDLNKLQLANPALTFVQSGGGFVATPRQPAAPALDAPTPMPNAEPEAWLVRAANFPDVRKLSRKQVIALIENEKLDGNAQASRSPTGEFRTLGNFREFDAAIRSQLAKVEAARRATELSAHFQAIVEEHQVYQQKHPVPDHVPGMTRWQVRLACSAVAIAALFFGSLWVKLLVYVLWW